VPSPSPPINWLKKKGGEEGLNRTRGCCALTDRIVPTTLPQKRKVLCREGEGGNLKTALREKKSLLRLSWGKRPSEEGSPTLRRRKEELLSKKNLSGGTKQFRTSGERRDFLLFLSGKLRNSVCLSPPGEMAAHSLEKKEEGTFKGGET